MKARKAGKEKWRKNMKSKEQGKRKSLKCDVKRNYERRIRENEK